MSTQKKKYLKKMHRINSLWLKRILTKSTILSEAFLIFYKYKFFPFYIQTTVPASSPPPTHPPTQPHPSPHPLIRKDSVGSQQILVYQVEAGPSPPLPHNLAEQSILSQGMGSKNPVYELSTLKQKRDYWVLEAIKKV